MTAGAPVALGPRVAEREVALVLLGHVQSEDVMEAVVQAAQLDDVLLATAPCPHLVQELAEAPYLVGYLHVLAAHRSCGVRSADRPVERRVELAVLRVLVRDDRLDQHPVHLAHLRQRRGGAGRPERVGDRPKALGRHLDGRVLFCEPPGQGRRHGVEAPDVRGRPQCTESVHDDGHVDPLLQQGAPHCLQSAQRRVRLSPLPRRRAPGLARR